MRRYDQDTATLLPEEYDTPAEACAAWQAEVGYRLADRVTMHTRSVGQWERWTMRRTGDDAPGAEWAAEYDSCEAPPRPRCVHCDGCGN